MKYIIPLFRGVSRSRVAVISEKLNFFTPLRFYIQFTWYRSGKFNITSTLLLIVFGKLNCQQGKLLKVTPTTAMSVLCNLCGVNVWHHGVMWKCYTNFHSDIIHTNFPHASSWSPMMCDATVEWFEWLQDAGVPATLCAQFHHGDWHCAMNWKITFCFCVKKHDVDVVKLDHDTSITQRHSPPVHVLDWWNQLWLWPWVHTWKTGTSFCRQCGKLVSMSSMQCHHTHGERVTHACSFPLIVAMEEGNLILHAQWEPPVEQIDKLWLTNQLSFIGMESGWSIPLSVSANSQNGNLWTQSLSESKWIEHCDHPSSIQNLILCRLRIKQCCALITA